MEPEGHHVTHEQIIDRVQFVARLAVGALAGLVGLAALVFGSCVATRDLVTTHEIQIKQADAEITALKSTDASLRATDDRIGESLRQIHGSVERIAGALGVRENGR